MIHCRYCDALKPESDFSLDTRTNTRGRQCKGCRRKAIEQYAREDPRGRAIRLRASAVQRAKRAGLPITITVDWVVEHMAPGRCAVTGIEFDYTPGKEATRPFAPSLDRIDPSRGYTPGNTQVVCWIYNRAKGDGNPEDVLRLARALLP